MSFQQLSLAYGPGKRVLHATTLAVLLALTACGGGDDDEDTVDTGSQEPAYVVPGAPAGMGSTDTAPLSSANAFVDFEFTNERGDARYATLETNAGVRVLKGFLDIWTPSTLLVDAGVTAPARDGFPPISPSSWTGIPGAAGDGVVKNGPVHAENLAFSIRTTLARTPSQAVAAYLDDRRQKNYSVTDGMGPLTSYWRAAARQTTTINDVASDATTVRYDDGGNNTGVAGSANPEFGTVIDFVNSMGTHASTEPAKRYFKYARPWRWTSAVVVEPTLEPAKSTTPATDGGFPSGHSAEAVRNAVAMAYLVPERFQEMVARGLELGENRIVAGMHSPLDVIGGRILGQATAVGNIYAASSSERTMAYTQARQTLMAAVGASTPEAFYAFAHSQPVSQDRFADHDANKRQYRHRLTFDFTQIGDTGVPAVVPKGAEVLLETRFPYLTADQRRVVLKTTALPSGYPVLDDDEGYGRLNLFDAADGYGAFNGDVTVEMDASLSGFSARDVWRNDIAGAGKLTKAGTGTLALNGQNQYSGGTEIKDGTLRVESASALGGGAVYVGGGVLEVASADAAQVKATYVQTASGALRIVLDGKGASRLAVASDAALAGALTVKFSEGYTPKVGDVLTVLNAAKVHGTFTSVAVDGFKVTPIYGNDTVQVRLDAAA